MDLQEEIFDAEIMVAVDAMKEKAKVCIITFVACLAVFVPCIGHLLESVPSAMNFLLSCSFVSIMLLTIAFISFPFLDCSREHVAAVEKKHVQELNAVHNNYSS